MTTFLDVNSSNRTHCNIYITVVFLVVLVAERVVKHTHPYLGGDVEVRLWSPLDDVADLEAVPAAHSTTDVINATAVNSAQDPVIYYAKKQRDQTQPVESLSDTAAGDRDDSTNDSEKKPPDSNLQSQTTVQAVPSCSTSRQMPSCLISDSDGRHPKCLSIDATSEAQFSLLKQMLDNGFAQEHGCKFDADERNWSITLMSKHEEGINLLAEQIYGYINNGTFEVEVQLSAELAQVLHDRCKQWLCDRLRRKVKEPAILIMNSGRRLAVVALSQNAAREAAKKLRECLLRGKVPLTEHQHKVATSAKFRKELNKIVKNKAIDVKTGDRQITVDGLPCDVVCTVSEITQRLYKH